MQACIDEWDTPFVDLEVFGTDGATEIAKLKDRFCLANLGSAVADSFEARPVLGHGDWRVEHLRFSHGQIVAALDWDSPILRREVEMVATAAHGFPMDWS